MMNREHEYNVTFLKKPPFGTGLVDGKTVKVTESTPGGAAVRAAKLAGIPAVGGVVIVRVTATSADAQTFFYDVEMTYKVTNRDGVTGRRM